MDITSFFRSGKFSTSFMLTIAAVSATIVTGTAAIHANIFMAQAGPLTSVASSIRMASAQVSAINVAALDECEELLDSEESLQVTVDRLYDDFDTLEEKFSTAKGARRRDILKELNRIDKLLDQSEMKLANLAEKIDDVCSRDWEE